MTEAYAIKDSTGKIIDVGMDEADLKRQWHPSYPCDPVTMSEKGEVEALKSAVDDLRSVLCDPEGNACIRGSVGDLAIVEGALQRIDAYLSRRTYGDRPQQGRSRRQDWRTKMTVDLTGHLKTCRRSHPHEEMDDVCERYTEYERELASLRAEKERAEAERDEAIRMRDRHAEASKAQNEDITALMAERDAALKDAERYRFLCEGEYQDDGEMWTAISNTSIKDEWDAEIDAAIDAARKGEQ